MRTALIGIGIPGAGKTTMLTEYAVRYGYAYVSPDDIRKELAGDAADQSRNAEVWEETRMRVSRILSENKNVIVDATFTNPRERKDFVRFLQEAGAERIIGLIADAPLSIAKERNRVRDRVVPEHAIERMHDSLIKEPPGTEEGFDALFATDGLGDLERLLSEPSNPRAY